MDHDKQTTLQPMIKPKDGALKAPPPDLVSSAVFI
jgi:hypothetical protein